MQQCADMFLNYYICAVKTKIKQLKQQAYDIKA